MWRTFYLFNPVYPFVNQSLTKMCGAIYRQNLIWNSKPNTNVASKVVRSINTFFWDTSCLKQYNTECDIFSIFGSIKSAKTIKKWISNQIFNPRCTDINLTLLKMFWYVYSDFFFCTSSKCRLLIKKEKQISHFVFPFCHIEYNF